MKNDSAIECRRWLIESGNDLKAAKLLLRNGNFSLSCFHGEQSAQKSLKAFLYFKGARFITIHSCAKLLEQCAGHDSGFAALNRDCRLLDQYYIPTRYPDAQPFPETPSEIYTKEQASSAVSAAGKILRLVIKKAA